MNSLPYDQLLQLLQARRSVRKFDARPVERPDLLRLFEAARWAPSNHNRQPWKFIVLDQPQAIQPLADFIRQHLSEKLKALPSVASEYAAEMLHYATFFASAPVLVIALHKRPIAAAAPVLEGTSNPALISGEPLSVAMAVQNLLLAAQVLGLGTCVLTGPLLVEPTLVAQFSLPAGFDLNCLIALGHPAETPDAPRRKPVEQIVEFRDQIQ